MEVQKIGTEFWNLTSLENILTKQIDLDQSAVSNIQKCRQYLDQKMQDKDKTYYGINTGFGSLCNVKISSSDIEQLQENLVLSHACGMGQEV
ncbi:MAG: aromatic amino acid lyase, partial [Chitinophagaceae bacterium]|nr:aromatic amino acid lyase [Chitinophagaceae bacterium]